MIHEVEDQRRPESRGAGKSLQTQQPGGALATEPPSPVRQVAEGATLHGHDILPPILQLAQAQSEKGTAGNFIRVDTDEEFKSLNVVPIMIQSTRTKWPAGGFTRDAKPECWSNDGLVGAPGVDGDKGFPGRACQGCEWFTATPWTADRDAGTCMPGYSVLVMDADNLDLYILRLAGTAAKLARRFASGGTLRRVVLTLYSEPVSKLKGSWYQLKATTLRMLDEADISLAREQFEAYAGVELKAEGALGPEETDGTADAVPQEITEGPTGTPSMRLVVEGPPLQEPEEEELPF